MLTYSVHLYMTGDKPDEVVRRLNEMLFMPRAEGTAIIQAVKPKMIADGMTLGDAEMVVWGLRLGGARCVVKSNDGATVIVKGSHVLPQPATTYSQVDRAKAAETAARAARMAEVAKEYPLELCYYHRAVLTGLNRVWGSSSHSTPEERRMEAEFVQQTVELGEWAQETLTGLFRIRGVISNSFQYNTIELTNEMDALYTKMRWQDEYATLNPDEVEWVWGSPARLFGDNTPSLAYEIARKQTLLHVRGEPFRFADSVELGLDLQTEMVEVETKDILFVLAPAEDQRDTFLKYCEEYGVMVHAISKPFEKTVVDKSLFNAIVSVDYDHMDSFENIWARGFARFKRDTRANSQLVRLNSPLG